MSCIQKANTLTLLVQKADAMALVVQMTFALTIYIGKPRAAFRGKRPDTTNLEAYTVAATSEHTIP